VVTARNATGGESGPSAPGERVGAVSWQTRRVRRNNVRL